MQRKGGRSNTSSSRSSSSSRGGSGGEGVGRGVRGVFLAAAWARGLDTYYTSPPRGIMQQQQLRHSSSSSPSSFSHRPAMTAMMTAAAFYRSPDGFDADIDDVLRILTVLNVTSPPPLSNLNRLKVSLQKN